LLMWIVFSDSICYYTGFTINFFLSSVFYGQGQNYSILSGTTPFIAKTPISCQIPEILKQVQDDEFMQLT